MANPEKINGSLMFPDKSVTVIAQSEYVPSSIWVNVMELWPAIALTVSLAHPPLYAIAPASVELNVYSGVLSFVKAGIGSISVNNGGAVSGWVLSIIIT